VDKIASAGLSRLICHALNNRFAIMSAFRGERSREDNIRQDRDLRSLLRHYGYGFMRTKGWYREDENNPLARYLNEMSLFIIGIPEDEVKILCEICDQSAYIWGEKGRYVVKDVESGEIWQEGCVAEDFRQMSFDEPPVNSTEIKGRRFTFDENRKSDYSSKNDELESETISRVASFHLNFDDSRYFFYSFEDFCKFLPASSDYTIKKDTGKDVPYAGFLEAWIPLKMII